MANVGKILGLGLLEAAEKGTQGYIKGRNKQREYAIQELAGKPSSAKEYEYWKALPPGGTEQEDYTDILTMKSPYYVESGKKKRLPGEPPKETAKDKIFKTKLRQLTEHNNKLPEKDRKTPQQLHDLATIFAYD